MKKLTIYILFSAILIGALNLTMAEKNKERNELYERGSDPRAPVRLMIQSAVSLGFTHDKIIEPLCAADGGIWSGTMMMLNPGRKTLRFSDSRQQNLDPEEFPSRFRDYFVKDGNGSPNAAAVWDDKVTHKERFVALQLSDPRWDIDNNLHYTVCGLPLRNQPGSQYIPPELPERPAHNGRVVLFINNLKNSDPRLESLYAEKPGNLASGASGNTTPTERKYIKLDSKGNPLPDQNHGYDMQPWDAVLDVETELMWEVKTSDGQLRDQGWTYTWYHGGYYDYGDTGRGTTTLTDSMGSDRCYDPARCDTYKYVSDVNAAGLAGYKDWRLPTIDELKTVVDNTQLLRPYVDKENFPNTASNIYWSSSPYTIDGWGAYRLDFRRTRNRFMGDGIGDKKDGYYVRLVRRAK